MSWIKIRTDLRTHPKVVRMAFALKADRLRILGGLQVVWSTFDTHSVDGLLEGYTLAAIDEELGWKGFASAMQSVHWLEETDAGLMVPEFDTHNGASAKKRAQDTKLKASNREADKSANGSWTPGGQVSATNTGQMSGNEADNSRTRVELDKRKKPPKPPKGGTVHEFPPGFEAFWAVFPNKAAKKAAIHAFAKLKPDDELQARIIAAVERQKTSSRWLKNGGEYIPNASTWLNGERWEDQGTTVQEHDVFAGAV